MVLFTEVGLAESDKEKLRYLWNAIKHGYHTLGIHKNQLQSLTFGMVRSAGAKLPQFKLRGNQMKHLAPVLRLIFCERMNEDNEVLRNILLGLNNCIRVDEILDQNRDKYALSEADATALETQCFQYGQQVSALILHYHPHTNRFRFTIKNHHLCHFGMLGHLINPALGSCHQGEDLMKVAKRLVVMSSHGAKPQQTISKAMAKYVRGVGLDLAGFGQLKK